MFSNHADAKTWLADRARDAMEYRKQLSTKIGVDMCYYEGVQWTRLNDATQMLYTSGNSVTRLPINFNPDGSKLRVTDNLITQLVVKVAAETFPDVISVDVGPPERDASLEAQRSAQVAEDTINALITDSGYLEARRTANMGRAIAGVWGVGWSIGVKPRTIDLYGETVDAADRHLKAFAFDPTRLVLDPFCQARSLDQHEWVMYSDVWTTKKVRQMYPSVEFDERDCSTVRQLMPAETELAEFSAGRLYSQYKVNANTKAMRVHQIHAKSPHSPIFDLYYVVIDIPKKDPLVVNIDSPETPFGGTGMPLALLHGHRRADSMWSISDVSMLRDKQDYRNMVASLQARHIQKHAGYQWVIDERSLPKGVSKEDAMKRLTNHVGGVLFVDYGRRDENRQSPQLVATPPPQPFVSDELERNKMLMREQVFRSEGSFGATKSHVPDSSFARAIEEADQVLGIRIREDLSADEAMLKVGLGTVVKCVREFSPVTVAMLQRAGFTDMDLLSVADMDPIYPACSVRIRESSVRYRSYAAKKQALDTSAQIGALDPSQYRQALADEGMDTPVTAADEQMSRALKDAVLELLAGGQWVPMPLGPYNSWAIDTLRRALFDKRAKADPFIRDSITQAIMMQTQMAMQEQAGFAPPPTQQTPNTPQTVGDALAIMTGQPPQQASAALLNP